MCLSHNSTDVSAGLGAISIRTAEQSDAAAIWRLVRDCPILELNSGYAYLLLCTDFRETCLVAEGDGRVAGFVTAYVPPSRGEVLFVWQIGVAPWARGRRLATRLLERLLQGSAARSVRFLEATVSPENEASLRLFRSLAEKLNVPFQTRPHFHHADFPDTEHDDEPMVRIGPLKGKTPLRGSRRTHEDF